jgi:elongation factor G
LLQEAKDRRAELIEQLAEVDEAISDAYLEDTPITTEMLIGAIRRATVARKFTPVFLGSAVKNTAVQPLLDGVCTYLPTPSDSLTPALDLAKPAGEQSVDLIPAAEAPLVALAFKLEEGRYGQLTYMRVYQGSIKKGGWIWHAKTGKRVKVPRLVRMHSNDMEVCRFLKRSRHMLTLTRTLKASALAKFVPSSVLIARQETPLPMVKHLYLCLACLCPIRSSHSQ